jgi:hypothetical protein
VCVRQDEVGVVTDGMVDFVARALQKDLAQRFGSAAEMLASLERSLTTSGAQRFDLFISYRVWCDKDFAQALFRAMSASAMRGGREFSMRVYLDKVRLLDGQRFDIGFMRGRECYSAVALLSRILLPNCFLMILRTASSGCIHRVRAAAVRQVHQGVPGAAAHGQGGLRADGVAGGAGAAAARHHQGVCLYITDFVMVNGYYSPTF